MAWNKAEPQDTTKIRNLGIVIRPNWDAVESADSTFLPQAINFANRTPLGVPNNPTAIADTVISFSKEDASGNPQFYTIDPSSTITQLTGGSLTAASPGKLVLPNGFTIIWGTINCDTTWTTKNFDLTGFSNNCFHISGNSNGSTKIIGFQLVSKTQYRIKCDTATANVFYMAIGN